MSLSRSQISQCVEYVRAELSSLADPEKAVRMQAYMKTDMPFYGVQKPARSGVMRALKRDYAPADAGEYKALVLALWGLPHREEKYLALGVASAHRRFHTPASMPLFEKLITQGGWWDLVDEVATHMVRQVILGFPDEAWATVDEWVSDEDMWLRRSAIICQVGAKEKTEDARLFRFCEERAFEKEFFIRKAIGWALREYSKTDPEGVARFAMAHRGQLSGLSFREATRHIEGLIS